MLCASVAPLFAGGGVDPYVLEYVRQTRVQRGVASYTVDVTFSAEIPSLNKKGVLRAIKRQDPDHQLYEGMNFQGDGVIKTNVIARYLQAEFDAQKPEEKLATEISPLNYKFTLKGEDRLGSREALVYEVKPLRHRPGLFRGTVWLDRITKLPLREQGKLEKIPSVWIKEIAFTRDYQLDHGLSLPFRIYSEVKTRIVGKAVITIDFSGYQLLDAASQTVVVENAQNDIPRHD
jgi:hypothetical protein